MTIKEHLQISRRGWKHLFSLEKRNAVLLVLKAFLSSIIEYIPIYFSAKVIDSLVAREALTTVALYVILTVGLVFLIKLILTYIDSLQNVWGEMMWRNEDYCYSEKAMGMSYASIEDPQIVRQRYRIRLENQMGYNLYFLTVTIENFVAQATKIAASLAMTGAFFAMPSIPAGFKLAVVVGLMLTLAVSTFSNSKTNKLQRSFGADNVDEEIVVRHLKEYMDGYGAGKDIRLYGMADFVEKEYWENNMRYYKAGLKLSRQLAAWNVPVTILNTAFQFVVYIVLIYAALSGGITIGSIAKYVACIMLLTESVKKLIKTIHMATENHHYLKRYFSYFDIPNEMYQGTLTVEKRDDNEYDIEFRDVSFRYPNTENWALRHVNLKFKVGEKLAVVGMNGSGKTTFIKLMCRLYDPTEGEILLNGVNIKKYDYDEYLSIFSVVFQDFQLFSFSLGQNVAASSEYDRERATQALIKAGFGERLAAMPNGLETYLYKDFDANGIEISGGEAQKIALARALYKNAPFIILDEPTAALDPVSEYEVYSKFNQISGDKTAIYISHRLASCRFCDKIAVFHEGSVVQQGSHTELVANENGKYYELWNAQARYYIE